MKKILSIILVLTMISAFVVSAGAVQSDKVAVSYDATDDKCISLDDAVKVYEAENGVTLETYRNYFYIPDGTESFFEDYENKVPTWYNEYFNNICIWYSSFMCENSPVPDGFCGYLVNKTDNDKIYYADIPVGVESFLINNGVDGFGRPSKSSCCSVNLGPEESEESDTLIYHDNMIYVLDSYDYVSMNSIAYFEGTWYYYYGDGCYGTEKTADYTNCIRDDHRDEGGKHITGNLIIGDVDSDGEVSILDATEIQMVLAKKKPLFEDVFIADFDGDGGVSVLDATAIQLYLSKFST